jgi:hypothetical protein
VLDNSGGVVGCGDKLPNKLELDALAEASNHKDLARSTTE